MRVRLSGVILRNLITDQRVDYVKVASKKYLDPLTKKRCLSLGGIGAVDRVRLEAWSNYPGPRQDDDGSSPSLLSAAAFGTVSVKGGPMIPDMIADRVDRLRWHRIARP